MNLATILLIVIGFGTILVIMLRAFQSLCHLDRFE